MQHSGLKASGFTLSLLFSVTSGLYLPPNSISSSLLESYDYIVVGGGASGLVVANRLSEDASGVFLFLKSLKGHQADPYVMTVTVLVLEAGVL